MLRRNYAGRSTERNEGLTPEAKKKRLLAYRPAAAVNVLDEIAEGFVDRPSEGAVKCLMSRLLTCCPQTGTNRGQRDLRAHDRERTCPVLPRPVPSSRCPGCRRRSDGALQADGMHAELY